MQLFYNPYYKHIVLFRISMGKNIRSIIGLGIFMCIVFAIPQLALSIADFVIGAQHKNATCDAGAFISLSTWLFVNGAIGLFFVIVVFVTLIVSIALLFVNPELVAVPLVPLLTLIIILPLFNLTWSIVGAVALFRDSMGCLEQTVSIWALVLVNLIIQWLSLAYSGPSACTNRNDNDK